MKANELIDILELIPHPEGGFYRETYRSEEIIAKNSLPDRYNNQRSFSTSIYFLLRSGEQHKLHRLKSDEIWHFYCGSPLKLLYFKDKNNIHEIILGNNILKGEAPQVVVPRDHWMIAHTIDKDSYTLVGCTTAPGFDFDDFEIYESEI